MKMYAFLFLTVFSLGSCANKTVNSIFSHYKSSDQVVAATVPGWLVEKGLNMAFKDENVELRNQIHEVVREIDKLRVLVSWDNPSDSYVKTIGSRLLKDDYELYAMVNHKDAKVNLWIKEKKGVVQDIFLFVNAEESIVLLQLKGILDMDKIEKITKKDQAVEQDQWPRV